MLMEDLFERLRTFQELLMERVAIEKEIRELPKSIAALEEVLIRARKSHGEKSARYVESKRKETELREGLAETVLQKEKSERQMDSISSPREFEALNKEITEAGLREDQLRKELKREDENYRESEEELHAAETLIQSQEQEINEKRTRIKNEETSMAARVAELRSKESKTTADIDSEVVFKFERIIRSKQGIGIVPVRGSVCSGCSMILPAQFVNEVRQSNKITFCPYCSRILYYQEGEGQEDVLVDIESGSLADFADDFADESEDDGYDSNDSNDDDKDNLDD
ncbi:MAG: nucleic acid-binding protein [Spirochaetales bacterium]|nr:MAG: nucleic acid-binding protein [Spirochaetales bacterium]